MLKVPMEMKFFLSVFPSAKDISVDSSPLMHKLIIYKRNTKNVLKCYEKRKFKKISIYIDVSCFTTLHKMFGPHETTNLYSFFF